MAAWKNNEAGAHWLVATQSLVEIQFVPVQVIHIAQTLHTRLDNNEREREKRARVPFVNHFGLVSMHQ